jgi:hypothetical protein
MSNWPIVNPRRGAGFDDAQEAERLGGLANADAADAEPRGHLLFGGQAIAGLELPFADQLLDTCGNLLAQILTLGGVHGTRIEKPKDVAASARENSPSDMCTLEVEIFRSNRCFSHAIARRRARKTE